MNSGGVQSARVPVDMRRDGIGAEDMIGEGIQLRRAVSEEEGEGDGRKGVAISVVCRVSENHFVDMFEVAVGSVLRITVELGWLVIK